MKNCPCGTGFTYTDCCGPLIRGVGHADTPEDLMRSRYTAFALKDWDYLKSSLHPGEKNYSYNLIKNQNDVRWTRLEVLGSKIGGEFDEEGEVSFVAHFTENGERKTMKEISKFFKVGGKWFYSPKGSKSFATTKTIQSKKTKVGRNEPCPCRSGKKFKKCCGK